MLLFSLHISKRNSRHPLITSTDSTVIFLSFMIKSKKCRLLGSLSDKSAELAS